MVGVWIEARTLGGVRTVVLFLKMACVRESMLKVTDPFFSGWAFLPSTPLSHIPRTPPHPTPDWAFFSSSNSRTKIAHASRICRSRLYAPSTLPHHAGADAGASNAPTHSAAELLCVTW